MMIMSRLVSKSHPELVLCGHHTIWDTLLPYLQELSQVELGVEIRERIEITL